MTGPMTIASAQALIDGLNARIQRLSAERDDAREQRRKWQEASVLDRAENARLRAELNAATAVQWTERPCEQCGKTVMFVMYGH